MGKINAALIESYVVKKKATASELRVTEPYIQKRLFRPNIVVPHMVKRWGIFAESVTWTIKDFNKRFKGVYYVEDFVVYEVPHVILRMASGEKHTIRFKTEAELEDFVKVKLSHLTI
jgi:hypothetical protein